MTDDRKEFIRNWLFRANEDIAVIENLIQSDPKTYASSICFHAQQAVEKFLKALLVYHDVDFPKTRDLDYLLSECGKIEPSLDHLDLKSLTDFGVSIRYPDDFYVPDEKETEYYKEVALKTKKAVESIIKT